MRVLISKEYRCTECFDVFEHNVNIEKKIIYYFHYRDPFKPDAQFNIPVIQSTKVQCSKVDDKFERNFSEISIEIL